MCEQPKGWPAALRRRKPSLKRWAFAFGDGVAFLDVETITGAHAVVTHRKVSERASQLGVRAGL